MRNPAFRNLAMLLLALTPLVSPAQNLLEGSNPDVLNALLFQGRSEAKQTVTRTLPADLARLSLPDDFTLIGTATRADGNGSTTAFRTSLDTGAAMDALLAALLRDGWEVEMPQQMVPQTFSTPSRIAARQLCRDGVRQTVSVRDHDPVRYAGLHRSPAQLPRPCHAPQPGMGAPDFQAMQRLMPTLDFPASVQVQGLGPSGGGSGDSWSAGTRVHSPEEPASALALHLSRQLTAQGWTRDAGWSGALGAGSSWTRQSERGALVGILDVTDVGDAVHDVQFLLLIGN